MSINQVFENLQNKGKFVTFCGFPHNLLIPKVDKGRFHGCLFAKLGTCGCFKFYMTDFYIFLTEILNTTLQNRKHQMPSYIFSSSISSLAFWPKKLPTKNESLVLKIATILSSFRIKNFVLISLRRTQLVILEKKFNHSPKKPYIVASPRKEF